MKVIKIEKKNEGKYITRYDVTYLLNNGEEKVYEIISRDKNITDISQLRKTEPDSVVLIMEDETGDKILLNREFRMSIGEWIYNFPAGLIDPGETPAEAAARELREETGLELREIKDEVDGGYSAIGFWMENKNVSGKVSSYVKSVDEIEALTGFDFFHNLDDAVETVVEKNKNTDGWNL